MWKKLENDLLEKEDGVGDKKEDVILRAEFSRSFDDFNN